jgi:ribosomal protein L29
VSKLSDERRRIEALGMAQAQDELKALRRRLFELRLQLARGEVKNNRQFPQVKASIARLMFHLSELNREALANRGEAESDLPAAVETNAASAESAKDDGARA